MAVFFRVLPPHLDRQPEEQLPGNAYQQVRRLQARRRGGKRHRKSIPDGEQLCGKVRAWGGPEGLGQVDKGIAEQQIGEIVLHPKYWTNMTVSSSTKGFTSMNGWRQTTQAQFDSSVAVVFKIGNQFCFKLLHGRKLLQIEQL